MDVQQLLEAAETSKKYKSLNVHLNLSGAEELSYWFSFLSRHPQVVHDEKRPFMDTLNNFIAQVHKDFPPAPPILAPNDPDDPPQTSPIPYPPKQPHIDTIESLTAEIEAIKRERNKPFDDAAEIIRRKYCDAFHAQQVAVKLLEYIAHTNGVTDYNHIGHIWQLLRDRQFPTISNAPDRPNDFRIDGKLTTPNSLLPFILNLFQNPPHD